MGARGKLRTMEGGRVAFWCPGCGEYHQVPIEGPNAWGFNGDYERPTFTPSVSLKSGHFVSAQAGKECWCTFESRFGRKPPFACTVCHSFVRDGRIEFLGDCTHALAGQTVDMPNTEGGA